MAKTKTAKKTAGKTVKKSKSSGTGSSAVASSLKFKVKVNSITEKGAQLVLQNVRGTFVKIAEPAPGTATIKPAYEITALIPKTARAEIEKIMEAATQCIKLSDSLKNANEKKEALANTRKIHAERSLLKDGDQTLNKDDEPYDGLADHYTIRAKTGANDNGDGTFSPKIPLILRYRSNENVPPNELKDQFYSGAWYDIAVTLKGYTYMKKSGVTCYLNGAMKLKNDTRLGGLNPFEARTDIADDSEGLFDSDENF